MSETAELFGHPKAADQLSLFGESENRMAAPLPTSVDHPARARAKMLAVLDIAREAATMPWSERDTRMWQTVFPQMANWLSADEGAQLVLEFEQQIERLKAA